jgi:anti-sigma B factor antagonist
MVELDFERHDHTALAILSGEIDMSNAASVRQSIAEFVAADDDAVIVDLSPLSFLDSAGLHALTELGAVLEEKRQRLLLCVPQGSRVGRAIEIVGMPRAISVYPDRDAAMEAARAVSSDPRPFPPTEDG